MEPFPKRQRLYTPRDSFFVHSFEEQHEYCETLDTELEDEEDEGDDNEPDEPIYDPEDELEQRRAQLDYKLKSTFEAIFEKYGKNFDGVGDEIDLATGEILVNNGHLLQMQDERDAGDISRARTMLRAFSVEPEDDMSSSLGDIALDVDEDDDQEEDEDEGEEEEENEDGEFSDDDVVEDDMILRGFAQASQFLHAEPSPEPTSSNEDFLEDSLEEQANPIASYVHESNGLPSRSDILAQFGPQLGPQIVDYISQKRAQDDSNIEPAWRVPDIPIPAHGRRPTLKSAVRKPEIERSLSPDTAPSLWAPAPTRGGGRNIRRESNAIFKDKRLDPIGYYGTLNSDHFESRSVPKKTRNRFTAEDDEILLDFVTKVRVRELGLAGESTWKQLEAMVIS
jgi:hypothetical protein